MDDSTMRRKINTEYELLAIISSPTMIDETEILGSFPPRQSKKTIVLENLEIDFIVNFENLFSSIAIQDPSFSFNTKLNLRACTHQLHIRDCKIKQAKINRCLFSESILFRNSEFEDLEISESSLQNIYITIDNCLFNDALTLRKLQSLSISKENETKILIKNSQCHNVLECSNLNELDMEFSSFLVTHETASFIDCNLYKFSILENSIFGIANQLRASC